MSVSRNGHSGKNGFHKNRDVQNGDVEVGGAYFNNPETKLFLLAKLKEAKYNPPERSDPSSNQGIIALAKSLAATKTCTPPWVTPDGTIIEGHRRVSALKHLEHTHVVCYVWYGDPNELYAAINSNQKPLNSNHKLYNYLKAPTSVTSYMAEAFARMERTVGRPAMEAVCEKKGGAATFKQALACGQYSDDTTNTFVRRALLWLVNRRMTCKARQFMDAAKKAVILRSAILNNVPLCDC